MENRSSCQESGWCSNIKVTNTRTLCEDFQANVITTFPCTIMSKLETSEMFYQEADSVTSWKIWRRTLELKHKPSKNYKNSVNRGNSRREGEPAAWRWKRRNIKPSLRKAALQTTTIEWMKIVQLLKGSCHLWTLHPAEIFFRGEQEIRTFSDKQNHNKQAYLCFFIFIFIRKLDLHREEERLQWPELILTEPIQSQE